MKIKVFLSIITVLVIMNLDTLSHATILSYSVTGWFGLIQINGEYIDYNVNGYALISDIDLDPDQSFTNYTIEYYSFELTKSLFEGSDQLAKNKYTLTGSGMVNNPPWNILTTIGGGTLQGMERSWFDDEFDHDYLYQENLPAVWHGGYGGGAGVNYPPLFTEWISSMDGVRTERACSLDFNCDPSAAPVPEPTTMLLLGSGLLGFAGLRKISPIKV